ncbi:DUF2157 domain-containing protein [Flagellimonas sp.]|uniref:DUF2157 domain-containing protein n=1 Tax=Flagellimonas sp. TaxID=2058762 RepID=UPI003B5C28DB
MAKVSRKDIQIINHHSNWSVDGIANNLKEHVYNGPDAWKRFLMLFFLGLGVSFTVAGILFFFAYNWDDLHKFAKIGLIEVLIIAVVSVVLFSKLNALVKNTLITAASVLVGVLLAVFGQVYQTGANAYDLFLGWTLLITLWVIVSNFPALWLIYICLINISIILYAEQVAGNWSDSFVFLLLFAVNSLFTLCFVLGPRFTNKIMSPPWFTNVLIFASVAISTIAISKGILDNVDASFWVLFLLVFGFYAAGIWYGLRNKQLIYLSLIPFSVIIIVSSFLIQVSDGAGMFFTVGFFIIGGVTLLIKLLLNLQKKWKKQV